MELTTRQLKFVDEYLVDLNATQAAVRSGYSARTATKQAARLMAHTGIQAKLEQSFAERKQRVQITQDYVLTTIQDTVERCRQATPVLDKVGTPTGEYRFDASGVLKGCELLGKHLQIFTEKVLHQGDPNAPLQVAVAHRLSLSAAIDKAQAKR